MLLFSRAGTGEGTGAEQTGQLVKNKSSGVGCKEKFICYNISRERGVTVWLKYINRGLKKRRRNNTYY